MNRHFVTGCAVMALSASSLMADFSYQQKTAITGGMAAAAMKVAGVFSKQAREPVVTTMSVKGDRMVHRSTYSATVIDLASQTITNIDLQKKTYSVMTFAEMKQMMEEVAQKTQQKDGGNVNFKVSANATGKTRLIEGLDAKEMIVKMQAETTDQKSGQSGAMVINLDIWLAPSVPGYQEVRAFHRRMAASLDWTPGSQAAAGAGVAKAMAEAFKEVGKMDGVPVYQTMSITGAGQPDAAGSGDATQPPPQQQQQQQQATRPSLAGALGGRFGLGRKKQDDTTNSASGSGSAQGGGNAQGSGGQSGPPSLMDTTTELSGFSSGPVDDAQFAVPAGFKKVEPSQRRGAR